MKSVTPSRWHSELPRLRGIARTTSQRCVPAETDATRGRRAAGGTGACGMLLPERHLPLRVGRPLTQSAARAPNPRTGSAAREAATRSRRRTLEYRRGQLGTRMFLDQPSATMWCSRISSTCSSAVTRHSRARMSGPLSSARADGLLAPAARAAAAQARPAPVLRDPRPATGCPAMGGCAGRTAVHAFERRPQHLVPADDLVQRLERRPCQRPAQRWHSPRCRRH